MNKLKIQKLRKAGFKVGSVKEFLNLSDAELALIDLKRLLIKKIREIRKTNLITQESLAKIAESSQSRIAKIEAGDLGVSLDLIFRVLFVLGVDDKEIGRVLMRKR